MRQPRRRPGSGICRMAAETEVAGPQAIADYFPRVQRCHGVFPVSSGMPPCVKQ